MSVSKLNEMVASGKIKLHHTSLTRGYVSRKTDGSISDYDGRFGKGFKILSPNWDSTRYCFVSYYIYA